MNIYVGNLSRDLNEGELREAFAAFGDVASAAIIKDKFSGETRGFGFVEMPNKDEAFREANHRCPRSKLWETFLQPGGKVGYR
jgi:hypothetical protein